MESRSEAITIVRFGGERIVHAFSQLAGRVAVSLLLYILLGSKFVHVIYHFS